MSVADATALAEVHLELHDAVADRAALADRAVECEPYSPWVALENAPEPECLLLDITGLTSLFGSEQSLAEQAARSLLRRGWIVRSGVADTPGAAWAVTHHGESGSIVPVGETLAALDPLPIEALRLSSATLAVLSRLGLCTIGQLLALPRESLAARFAPELAQRLDQATGALTETLPGHRPPPEITAVRQFEYPIKDRAAIELVVGRLVEELVAILKVRQQGALQIECEFACTSSDPLRLVVGLFQASAVAKHLRELILLQLEQQTLPGPVESVRLSVLLAARLQNRQRELFDDPHDDERELALLVDRLSGRLGRQAVVRPVLVPDAQPEYAYRYEPLAGSTPRRSRAERNMPARPLWLSPHPVPIQVAAIAPGGQPVQFRLDGRRYVTARAWGPERIQTGWWRGRYVRRDYYRVETMSGQRFWLYRSGSNWFLHGWFD